ncbi:MAG: hypothetical protein ACI85I_001595 [Arenicella sp.]|jgi:hypothetical protein
MKFNFQELSQELIANLILKTERNLKNAEKLNQKGFTELNQKANSESWSALECLQHLNLYGDFYLPEVEQRMKASKHKAQPMFKSSWLGNKFAEILKPREKLNKMPAPKDKNPVGSKLDKAVVERFITQQHKMLSLLEQAKSVNLQKTKASITLSKFIKLRLGDIFRVVIYHNERHLEQAFRAVGKEVLVSS